jgi:two-component system, LuxR family, sensor kinase FixL
VASQAHAIALPAAPADSARGWTFVRILGPAAVVGLAYYAGCLAGFALRFPQSGISFFWPPTAVLTVALLLGAPRSWGLFLSTALAAHAVAHLQDGVPPGALLIQFLGNACQALIAAAIVRRYQRRRPLLADTRNVLIFVAGVCVAAPAVASLIPASVYVSLGWAPNFVDAWLARSLSNAVASLSLVPALIGACQFILARPVRPPARVTEFGLLLCGIVVAHYATAFLVRSDLLGLSVVLYAPTPFLIWAMVRFGLSGLSFAVLWTTLLTASLAAAGLSPLLATAAANGLLGVQVLVGAEAVLLMIIGGLLEDKRVEHARLIEAAVENDVMLTELRVARHRYELATASGAVGVWDGDLREGHVHLDGDVATRLGYRADEIENTTAAWMRLVSPADRPEVESQLAAMRTGISSGVDLECRMCRRDGSFRWFTIKGAVTERVGGMATRASGTYTDITERKEADAALREATAALARTWRAVTLAEFSASLAHELNQPLAAIAANVEAGIHGLDGSASTNEMRRALNDTLTESRRAAQIVARTQAMFSTGGSERVPLRLSDAIRDIVSVAQPRLRELEIALELRLDDTVGDVLADAVQVRQVLMNLVGNAREAMRDSPAARRRLRIITRRCRSVAVIDVRDTGCGFPPDVRARIFEPFYSTKPDGTGMGLAICRSVVESHGGSICALRNAGAGATFRIRMPLAEPPPAIPPPSVARRVLIVDDHDGIRASIARLVHAGGHEVAEAASGAEAITLARVFQPDCAIVDISMRGMNGLELARQLKAEHADGRLRLIALTGYRDDGLREACLAAGFDTYLIKPEGIHKIHAVLARP